MAQPIILSPGAHVAHIPITVPTTGVACTATIRLTTDPGGAPSGNIVGGISSPVTFTSTGAVQNVDVPLTVPTIGTPVYVETDITLNGNSTGQYYVQGSQLASPVVTIGTITWT